MKATKAFKQHFGKAKRGPLADEQPSVHLNFTLTKVPAKPSVKPLRIKLDTPYTTKENLSRVCLFVKDPDTDVKE